MFLNKKKNELRPTLICETDESNYLSKGDFKAETYLYLKLLSNGNKIIKDLKNNKKKG